MKPYLAAYLRDRDLQGFREVLEQFTRPSYGHVRRVLMNAFGVLVPAMMEQFPSLTEREMWELAIDRIAALDIPADLDELEGRQQRERFRAFLANFVTMTDKTPAILRPGFRENLHAIQRNFPALGVDEMRAMTLAEFDPDSQFIPGPHFDNGPLMPPPPADEMSPRIPRESPSVGAPPQPSAAPRAPRSGECS